MIAIFRPDGSILAGSAGESRKAARAMACVYTGRKWNALWQLGWRVRVIL